MLWLRVDHPVLLVRPPHLLLVCFAPSYDPTTQSTMVDEEASEGERRMKKYLFDAIVALKHVSNVRLAPHIFNVYSYSFLQLADA